MRSGANRFGHADAAPPCSVIHEEHCGASAAVGSVQHAPVGAPAAVLHTALGGVNATQMPPAAVQALLVVCSVCRATWLEPA